MDGNSSSDELRFSQESFRDLFSKSLGSVPVDDLLAEFDSLEETMYPEFSDVSNLDVLMDHGFVDPNQISFIPQPMISFPNYGGVYPPATVNLQGEYGFDIYFEPQAKGNTWIYNKERDKLYVTKDMAVPINFFLHSPILLDAKIRVMAVFSQAQYCNDVVTRCSNHILDDTMKGVLSADHLIRCESKQAVYEKINDAFSVVVPYEMPQSGQHYSTYIYKFVCFGSCPGGLNRRPIKIIFILESQNLIIGQRCIDVKICASPTRDSKNDEKQLTKKPSKRKVQDDDNGPVEPLPIPKQEDIETVVQQDLLALDVQLSAARRDATSYSSCPPATNNWSGFYGFSIQFNSTSGKSYLYHPKRDKLYISKDVACTISFTTAVPISVGMVVRVSAMFSHLEHANSAVQRCPLHQMQDMSAGKMHASHLIHCDHRDATYHIDPINCRQSVVVPIFNSYDPTSPSYNFMFCCFGSCPGGLNRRPIKIVFTLEKNNEPLGRRSLDVKICASPLRDCKNDDKLSAPPEKECPENSPPKKKKAEQSPAHLRNLFQSFNVMDTSNLDPGNQRSQYIISVTNPLEYEYLLNVRKAYQEQRALKEEEGVKEETSSNDDSE